MSELAGVSVLMPCFNAEKYIEVACESVLRQMEPGDELLIQDGNSTDGTLAILRRLSAESAQVKVLSEPDSGQSDALNRALDRASNPYVLWVNADDVVIDGGLRALRDEAFATDQPRAFVVGGHRVLREDGSTVAEYIGRPLEHDRLMLRGCYVFSGSVLVSKDELIAIGGFSTRFHYCMDLDLMLRLAQTPRHKRAHIERPVGALRWHDASKSGGQGASFLREGWVVRREYFQSRRDVVFRAIAFMRQALSLATVGLRHSKLYRTIRGARR